MGLRRRWAAHVDELKEKEWERAADHGESGIDLEDIGEHMNDALPTDASDPGWLWWRRFLGFWR